MRVFSAFIFGQKRVSTAMANIVNDLSRGDLLEG
jgi:hypothetical protein